MKGREVLRKLKRAGFEVIRIKGSAHYLRYPTTGRFTSVHLHGNQDIPPTLLHKIVVHQAGLTVEEFLAL
ncbi:MAG: type II toxin-antitoxin system HicA family toxin [Nitrospirae bacterium]|nr:type II toxin-antitoxin system HicA family toxin [Nitrospirota bacterium]